MVIKGSRKFLMLFVFITIIMLKTDVFALDYNVTSTCTSPTGGSTSGGKYTGTELNGSRGPFNFGTRYNGTLTGIEFNLYPPSSVGECFWSNMTYKITLNMATEDWRNRFGTPYVYGNGFTNKNFGSSRVTFVSYKKVYLTFKIPSSESATCYEFMSVKLQSNELFTPFTGETNWNFSSVILSDSLSNGGSSGGGSSSPTPTPQPSNQDIIDNATQNTNDIISNNNDNTQDIIDNNNANANMLNESINSMCKDTTLTITDELAMRNNAYLTDNGAEIPLNSAFVSRYLKLKPNSNYTIKRITGGSTPQTFYYCLYRADKGVYSCSAMPSASSTITFTSNDYTTYLRVSFYGYRTVQVIGSICNDFTSERQQETTDAINQVNDSINNDNIDSGTGSDFFSNFDTSDNGGISSIVTKPLVIINNLLSNNNSCNNLTLPNILGVSNAELPSGCILWNNVPSSVVAIWNTFVCGLASYYILKDIFKIIEKLKNPTDDSVEVIDL